MDEDMKVSWTLLVLFPLTPISLFAQNPFKPISTLNASTIQGRPVQLDAKGLLLPWPRPNHVGFSYEGYFMSRWGYLWEQHNHQRYYDFLLLH
jgi:hypothetical protein